MKKETWKTVIQIVISILTAIATSLGVTSCMCHTLSSLKKALLYHHIQGGLICSETINNHEL